MSMIELEITDFSSADVDEVWKWRPDRREDVFIQLTIEISEAAEPGGHLFQVVVATPEGLRQFATDYPEAKLPRRGLMVVSDFKWDNVLEELRDVVRDCSRESWNESIDSLQRYFIWEYEE